MIKIIISIVAVVLLVGGSFMLGWWLSPSGGETDVAEEEVEEVWTCPMHPQVRDPSPGACPYCGMDLILARGDDDEDDRDLPRLRLSERSMALMNIQTAPVRRQAAGMEMRLPGMIGVDETRRSEVAAWFGGRVDRLYVEFDGVRVQAGEHLLEMYSPQLFGAQEEFLQALRAHDERGDSASEAMVEAARGKLQLLGLSALQIETIVEEGSPTTHLTYHSPVEGTVLDRLVTSGQYVETGTPLYVIADLTHLWVNLQAYESELAWLRYGQEVEVETTAFPGEPFSGRIAYIDPNVDARQRTARVRVNLTNEERRLKPGMLATGKVAVRVSGGGRVIAEDLDGRWISPMHPEIVKDAPGECDICGMDLVPIEEMGYYAGAEEPAEDPLVIPASAPLLTGKRGIVYVRLPDTERPTFEAREVVLGNRLGEYYLVESGLEEGELVVVNGQFKIDSELQIRGRPSMMEPLADDGEEDPQDPREAPEQLDIEVDEAGFSEELKPLLASYLEVVEGLAGDDVDVAMEGMRRMHDVILEIGEHRLSGDAHALWMEEYQTLHGVNHAMADVVELEGMREHLQELTHVMERIYVNFGGGELPSVYRAYCPMVEGGYEVDGTKIGTWLQEGEQIANPYHGASMLRCGEVIGELGKEEVSE